MRVWCVCSRRRLVVTFFACASLPSGEELLCSLRGCFLNFERGLFLIVGNRDILPIARRGWHGAPTLAPLSRSIPNRLVAKQTFSCYWLQNQAIRGSSRVCDPGGEL